MSIHVNFYREQSADTLISACSTEEIDSSLLQPHRSWNALPDRNRVQCERSDPWTWVRKKIGTANGVCVNQAWFTFTFMHLADAFIQSDLHCIQVTVSTFYQLLLSLGIEPMILALLVPCSTSWATGKRDGWRTVINGSFYWPRPAHEDNIGPTCQTTNHS